MKLAVLCGEISGLQGSGALVGLEESVQLVYNRLKVVEHLVDQGIEWVGASVHKEAGQGGRYAAVVFASEERFVVKPTCAPANWTPNEVFYRIYVRLPSQFVSSWNFPEISFTEQGAYGELSNRCINLRFLSPSGLVQLRQYGTVLAMSTLPFVWDGVWRGLLVGVRNDPVNGRVRVWFGDNPNDVPAMEYQGNTRYTAAGLLGTYHNTAPRASGYDDGVLQSNSQRVVKATGGAAPSGFACTWYDAVGAATATGAINVSGVFTALQFWVGDVLLTGVAGARTPGLNDFSLAAADLGTEIAAAINDTANGFGHTATASLTPAVGVVALTAAVMGTARNNTRLAVLLQAGGTAGVTAFSGGVDGTPIGTGTIDCQATDVSRYGRPGVIGPSSIKGANGLEWNWRMADDVLVGSVYVQTTGLAWSANVVTPNGGLDADSGLPEPSYFPEVLVPTGPGAFTELTPVGAAANWANAVGTFTPADDVTYNTTVTLGATDTYTMSAPTVPAAAMASVRSVMVLTRAQRDNLVIPETSAVLEVAGVRYYGHGSAIGTSYTTKLWTFSENPATLAPWTPPELATLVAGVRFEE